MFYRLRLLLLILSSFFLSPISLELKQTKKTWNMKGERCVYILSIFHIRDTESKKKTLGFNVRAVGMSIFHALLLLVKCNLNNLVDGIKQRWFKHSSLAACH